MKQIIKATSLMLAFSILFSLLSPIGVTAAEGGKSFYMTAKDNPTLSFNVFSYEDFEGNYFLFVPKTQDLSKAVVRANFAFSNVSNADVEGDAIVCKAYDGFVLEVDGIKVTFLQSSVPAMHLSVKEGYSLETIQADKNAKIKATSKIVGAENEKHNLIETEVELKTRGNSTFWMPKQPYQIKFNKKTDLFGMGKAKKWVLLANYTDGTFVRNKVAYDLGEEMGMPYTCQSVFVDLYIDGVYYGIFQLSEKVEIGDSRVPLEDDYGVVMEMDSYERYLYDEIRFYTETTGKAIVYKEYVTDFEETEDPEEVEKTALVKEYVENYINTFEKELYTESPDWEKISKLIDVDSFVDMYYMSEFAMEYDIGCTSTYFYMDGKDDILHIGPLWDYDSTFGYYSPVEDTWNNFSKYTTDIDLAKNIKDTTDNSHADWYTQLFRIPEFAKAVNDRYDEIKDILSGTHVASMFENYRKELSKSLVMNSIRWGVGITRDEFSESITLKNAQSEINRAYSVAVIYSLERANYIESAYGSQLPLIKFTPRNNTGAVVQIPFMPEIYDVSDPTPFEMISIEGENISYTGGQASIIMYDENGWQAPINAFSAEIVGGDVDGGVEYSFFSGLEESPVFGDGELAHMGEDANTAIHKIRFKLTGNAANYYSIQYRVAVGGRWSDWGCDGEYVGTDEIYSRRALRLQMRIVKKADVEYGQFNFYTADGVYIGSQSEILGNSEALVQDAPRKLGYSLGGWYDNADLTGEPVESALVEKEEKNFYAKYVLCDYVIGDSDGDDKVTMRDAILLRRYLTGLAGENEIFIDRAFATQSQTLSMRDVIAIRRILLGFDIVID